MNTEEIKMIIELLSKVSDGTYSLILLFIIKSYLSMLLGYALGGFGVYYAYKTIKYLTDKYSFLSELKDIMGFYGDLSRLEKNEIRRALMSYNKNVKQKQ